MIDTVLGDVQAYPFLILLTILRGKHYCLHLRCGIWSWETKQPNQGDTR